MTTSNILDARTARIREIHAMAGKAFLDGPKKYKVDKLEGPLLDLAVANAEGIKAVIHLVPNAVEPFCECSVLNECGRLQYQFMPSRNWAQGGPIVEREMLGIMPVSDAWWRAGDVDGANGFGPTPLVAAMRCHVESKLGDEVEL